MFWNKPTETMAQDKLRDLQTERLKNLIERVYRQQPFYRGKMQEASLLPQDINTLEDIRKLPFTIKKEMRDNYPYGLLSVPLSEIVRLHISSGTTGLPTVVGYTNRDLGIWSEVMARALTSIGATKQTVIQIAHGYGLFTGGLGVHYGAELIGASVIPASVGNTERQILLIKDFGTTLLNCTPSYALHIAETMHEMGISPQDNNLKLGIFGGEPWSETMRQSIETQLGIKAHDLFGMSEIIGPGVASECLAQDGLHINEDHFYPEIIDPETGQVLPDGEPGELVLTTLTKDGMPMVRYRTRDLTVLNRAVCSCGKTFVRMRKAFGRSDDMIIIRGVNVFPSQVENILLGISQETPHYQMVVDRKDNLDQLTLLVEVTNEMFSDEHKKLKALETQIKSKLHNVLGVSLNVRFVGPKTLERFEGKAKRVIDNRNI